MMGPLSRISGRAVSWAVVPILVFFVLLAVLTKVNGSDASRNASAAAQSSNPDLGPASAGDTAARVASLEAMVAENPNDAEAYALLGDALYQRFRETADPTLIARAQEAADSATRIDPDNVTAVIGQGTLALTRHDFRDGLDYGLQAHRIAPDLVRPYNIIADAQIELGRYDAAGRTLQRFIDLKPSLPAYARVSYFRELNGDIDGAVEAMRLAVATGGGGESLAYVQTLLGRLEFDRGRYGAAGRQYRSALAADAAGYTPALAGLARVDAARGDFDSAIRRYREVVERLPLPEYAIALAETELAAGRDAAGEQSLALVEVEQRLLRSAGVNVDTELAIFEADHGQPERAIALGAQTWKQAPSVRSADAYSWALHSAGRTEAAVEMSREAMRLGSRDPSFLYHAGQIALAAGDLDRARELLGRLVAQSPDFNPLFGPRAERALAELR